MTRKQTFGLKNNFPLLLALLVVVFVIPLNVFAVTFQKLLLEASASTKTLEKQAVLPETKTILGTLRQVRQDNITRYFLYTSSGKQYQLVSSRDKLAGLTELVNQQVVVSGSVQNNTLLFNTVAPVVR